MCGIYQEVVYEEIPILQTHRSNSCWDVFYESYGQRDRLDGTRLNSFSPLCILGEGYLNEEIYSIGVKNTLTLLFILPADV